MSSFVKNKDKDKYGIVLDAGSSHTAMFIYKWPANKQNGTGIVSQHTECQVKGGGISIYAGIRGGAAKSLQECMEQAVKDIPKSRHKLTPLYLGATAGMRLLNISKPKESGEILKEVGDKLKTYPFSFKGATILSGQEEGAYGWVTVNYLLENYVKYGFVGHWLSSGRPTVGSLDFGRASTQITFVTKETVENKDNQMNLRLYGQDYMIYTPSFLCYGRDQVLLRLLAHPIMAFSAFYYTHNVLQETTGITITSPAHLENSALAVCNMSFQEMKTKGVDKEERLKDYCAVSIFVQELLVKGYGFDDVSIPHISFQKNAGGTSVGWSLGYMLRLSNLLPAEDTFLRKALPSDAWNALIALFSLLIITAVFFLLRASCKKESDGVV
ncbi:ectonucleoside triphosphate diphosphohydrolase 2-like [Triplophysa dalaica]|uniref:ectonucleoside triphosphate diphosphohydrolase 2-like n=1 Tax=Triplophysa dalaica TaxID=1582913 RepID=UPI0024DF6ABE|nr:ectonucleoside triphosphate diphosphohydrolase 2-like [Triplophysa dalaica]